MRLKTTLFAEVKEEGTYFEHFKMTMLDEGLQIEAKSPLFASWIKSLVVPGSGAALPRKNPWYISPTIAYPILSNPDSFPPRGVTGYIYPGEPGFFSEHQPNLLWLLHPGLAEGFSLTVKQPITLNDFEDYFAKCCDAIRDIYVTQLRKATLQATFSELWSTP